MQSVRLLLILSSFFIEHAAGQGIALNKFPSLVIGQPSPQVQSGNPNYVEGRELFNPASVAVDTSLSPPAVYVSDTGNNRVLGWRDASSFQSGAFADIVLGQRDLLTTLAQGPGTGLTTGLAYPTGITVDGNGNLYVADSGNNRILRYPRPFNQGADKFPDMVIGQSTFSSRLVNGDGTFNAAANSIALNLGGSRIYRAGLVFDRAGNLWFSDSGNHRVLRYPAAALARGANRPAADQAVGQFSLTTNAGNAQRIRDNKAALLEPSGLAIDTTGRLYVCDALSRVLVYPNPSTGASAARIMGIALPRDGIAPPPVNDTSLGAGQRPPEGVFVIGTTPFVVDTGANRIVRYDPFESWPSEGTSFSPPGRQFIGQTDSTLSRINRDDGEPKANGFDTPVAAVATANEVWVVDSGNHRVLVFPIQNGSFATATRLLGQTDFFQSAPNYIEGRDLFLFNGFARVGAGSVTDGAGLAIDNSSSPPHLYVADTFNHRILGYFDARTVANGAAADIVIGQRDFKRSNINDPSNDVNAVSDTGLMLPAGLVVDAAGNLYVADAGNGRVLRFPNPFDPNSAKTPDLVLGQTSLFNKIPDATSRTMARPFGLAFSVDGHLLVSDAQHNRILMFRRPPGGDFSSGQAADLVIGQPDFSSVVGSNAPNRMISPRHIAVDTDDRLYVCDTGNNRVLIYDRITLAFTDPSPALALTDQLSSPHGVFVSPVTGEIWVANTGRNQLRRYPLFQFLVFDPSANYTIDTSGPLVITQDAAGNLFSAEGINRVSVYFPGMSAVNGGNRLQRFAPGAVAVVRPVQGAAFADSDATAPDGDVLPKTLGDIEVRVNGSPAYLKSVSKSEISFLIPYSVTPGQAIEVTVARRSSGQILAATALPIDRVAPAFFSSDGTGRGQLMCTNEVEGKPNSPLDKVSRSGILHCFGTGVGAVPGAPEEGRKVADKMPIPGELRVAIGAAFLPADNILYFGMAPGMFATWMVSMKVPDNVAPADQVNIAATFNSVPTNQDSVGGRVQTFIAVKP